MQEKLKRLRDICKSYHSCYDGCPLDVDKVDCVMAKPLYIWSDEDIEKITQLVEEESCETRLKADMIDVLTELQLEIEEKEQYYQDKFLESKNAVHDAAMGGRMFGCGECKDIIQQKIDALKGGEYGMKDVFSGDKIKDVRGNRATELLEHISELFTKEEVIAIFTEIQLEIEDLKEPYYCCHYKSGLNDCKEIIQQKINNLKGNKNGNE